MTGDEKFFRRSPILAYLASVTAATFVFILPITLERIAHFDYISLAGDSFISRIYSFLEEGVIAFCAFWIATFLTALLPFVFGWSLAKKMRIQSPAYFISGATLTGLLIGFIIICFVWGEHDRLLLHKRDFALYAISGLVAGITCWLVIRPR